MKTVFLLVLCVASSLVRGETLTATITEQTKIELTRGKGTIVLKPGTKVEVVSQDGEMLGVVYHSITGLVPAAKTDFKGEVPKVSPPEAKAEPAPKPAEIPKAAPAPKSAEAKSTEEKPSIASREPTTNYGKMVKKAYDTEANHKENLVDPVNEVAGASK